MQGPPHLGYKWACILQTYGLVKATPGRPFYVTNESEQRTYSGTVNPDGTLSNLRLFAEQGGENLAQDEQGNVYLAAGQVFVYNAAGKRIDTITVPERPLGVVFGGKDRKHTVHPHAVQFVRGEDTLNGDSRPAARRQGTPVEPGLRKVARQALPTPCPQE